jgi:DNA-directed RNA polymerase specialized sigma24 family protein
MDELNLHLQSIIQEACSYLPASHQHRQAMNRLLRIILKSKRIWRPAVGNIYEETLYEEALSKAMFKLTKTLCEQYDWSKSSFFTWFNTCLHNQYIDEIRVAKRDRAHKQSVWQGNEPEIDPLDQLESPVDASLLVDTWESFVQWITTDPDRILRNCQIENNPNANCQLIAHLRLVVGKEWHEIAVEVGSSRGAVTSHWSRKCDVLMREWLNTNQRLFGEDNYE